MIRGTGIRTSDVHKFTCVTSIQNNSKKIKHHKNFVAPF